MPFLNNEQFKEIKTAAGDGNEKAAMVLQALRKGSQEDVDRLVKDYYTIPEVEVTPEVQETERIETSNVVEPAQEENIEPADTGSDVVEPEVQDLTELLDKETDGLFDENELDTLDFATFLSNKKRDGLRATKNADYFKAFDLQGRENYLNAKKENYKNKFGDSLHDIDRTFIDNDKSIDRYAQGIGDLLDDEIEVDSTSINGAYNDITENNSIMHSFGRHWDDDDTNHVIEDLKLLVGKYGKQNVLAALNVLKSDNSNFKDYKTGQINEEIERYNKSLDKVLK